MVFNKRLEFVYPLFIACVALLASARGFAEDSSVSAAPVTPTPSVTEAAKSPTPPTSKVFGTLDLRAEYWGFPGAWDTSNFFQIGYQFNPDVKVSWYQGFDSNIYKANLTQIPGAAGLNPVWDQGFLRTRVSNIWKSGKLEFDYESRIYVPTLSFDSQMGNVTRLYNAFKLIDKFNDTFTFSAIGVVSPQIYNVAGTAFGGPNPWLENRLYLVTDIQITSKLSLTFPILLYQDKYRDYAANPVNILLGGSSGDWGYYLYVWPELDYALTENLTLGLAYVSGNMVKPDFSGTTFDTALKTGIVQFVVTMNL